MLKTYQFKIHCKGGSHSSKTVNIILPGLMIKQRWTTLRLQAKWYSNSLNCITGYVSWNNLSHPSWIAYYFACRHKVVVLRRIQIICCCRTTDVEQSAGRSAPSWHYYVRFRRLLKGHVWLRLQHLVTLFCFWAPCTNILTLVTYFLTRGSTAKPRGTKPAPKYSVQLCCFYISQWHHTRNWRCMHVCVLL